MSLWEQMASPGTFHDMNAIIHDLRNQLTKRGGADGIRTLGLCFDINDRNRSGALDLDEFEAVLNRCGLFLKKPDISALFRFFDRNNNKKIEYSEFLRGIAGPLNERRQALIKKAFAKLDKDGGGTLDLADISALYNASKHPDVVTGKKTAQQVYNEFLRGFVDPNDGKAHADGVPVTLEDFQSYYADISASVPGDDDLFSAIVCNSWGITEGPAGPVASADLAKFIATVKEKIRQKAKGKNEKVFMRNTFKFFDLDRSNTVSYSEFLYALEKFGVVLDEKSSRGLFASLDTSGNGRLSYDEFAAALYDEDFVVEDAKTGGLPSPKGPQQQTQQLSATQQQQFGDAKSQTQKSVNFGATSTAAGKPKSPPPQQQSSQYADKKHSAGSPTTNGTAAASSAAKPNVIFVLGGPGSGKGTQCARIAKEFGFVHLSTGDLLRAEQEEKGSPYGQVIAKAIADGKMVPGDVTVNLLKTAITKAAAGGKQYFLVDGFPRNEENLKGWNKLVAASVNVPFVLFFDCPEDLMTKRLAVRGKTSGRADDNANAVGKRLTAFSVETVPIVKQFATVGKVKIVNAVPAPDAVYLATRQHIVDLLNSHSSVNK